ITIVRITIVPIATVSAVALRIDIALVAALVLATLPSALGRNGLRSLRLALIATLPAGARLRDRLRTPLPGFFAATPAALRLGLLLGLGLNLSLSLILILTLDLLLLYLLLRHLLLALYPLGLRLYHFGHRFAVEAAAAVFAALALGVLGIGHARQCDRHGGQCHEGGRLQKSRAGHRRSPFVGAARGGSVDNDLGQSR
ncbi:MAG: hypothetical protein H7241_05655, partial [Novosphingobium sp.]|nr:hypothetical protein [Novosphingobium sp.]